MTPEIIVHKAEEGGFWAEVPDLPGCVSQGETVVELEKNIREAIELWLETGDDGSYGSEQAEIHVHKLP